MKKFILFLFLLFAIPVNSQQSSLSLFYVATSVDSNGGESSISNEALAVVSPTHSIVNLSWIASTSTVAGYNVYRGKVSGGPYSKINTTLITGLSFTDTYTFPTPPSTLKTVVP
jgi:hypothetical protein